MGNRKGTKLVALGITPEASNFLSQNSITSAETLSVATGITATGTTIADARALTALANLISTTPVNSGVKLPDVDIGVQVTLRNAGANDLKVYPPSSSGIINAASAGAAITLAATGVAQFTRVSSTTWIGGYMIVLS